MQEGKSTCQTFKGIVSDSNNIFLWHEPEDINKKDNFQNFGWFQFYVYKLMHDYVHWHCSIDYVLNQFLLMKFYVKIAFISH